MFVGDRVRDVEDGDVGVITKPYHGKYFDGWWILWETGDFTGQELWLEEYFLELIEDRQ